MEHQQHRQPHAAAIHERLGDDHGELRIYRRPGPPEHLAFEVLRESDGRAWTVRVPWSARAALREALDDTLRLLTSGVSLAFDEQDCAELARRPLTADAELMTVMLRQGEERAFAVWRRELARQGWGWTLDVVVTPGPLAEEVCRRMLAGLERLEAPSAAGRVAPPPPHAAAPAGADATPPKPS